MADLMESRCGSLPTAQLTPHAEQFLSLLERKGIVPDQEITNEKARSADKALRKNMYHNTRLMLQHYRDHRMGTGMLPRPGCGGAGSAAAQSGCLTHCCRCTAGHAE